MSDKKKAYLRLLPVALLFVALCVFAWIKPADEFSLSERRPLAQMPGLSADKVLSGDFMVDFEDYTTDQFPLREPFRKLQSFLQFNLLGQKDVNDIYIAEGSAAKIEDPVNDKWVQTNAQKIEGIFENHFAPSGSKAFFALIPDKNFYLAEKHGYPGVDYHHLLALLKEHTDFARWIDLTGTLQIGDYYATDSHWRQERIHKAAQALADALGVDISQVYTENLAREDFSGVYAGQSALPLKPETMIYLTSDELSGATLFDYETQKTTGLYDLEELWGRDPYDLYLSGAAALQVIENPAETSGRELVLFRDSFGSSMAPLLVPGYSKITLVDLRYFSSTLLEQFVPANGQDVLFLYSPGIMNSTNLLK